MAVLRILVVSCLLSFAAANVHREPPKQPLVSGALRGDAAQLPPRLAAAPARFKNRTMTYVEGMFDNSYSPSVMLADAQEVAASGFSVVILAFLHVESDGSIRYNNIPFGSATSLPQCLSTLRNGSVSTILISLGGAGSGPDFDHMLSNWNVFSAALVSLVNTYHLDGIDIDIEGSMGSHMTVLQNLVNLGVQNKWVISGAPCCGDDSNWATLLKSTAVGGKCAFTFMNYQSYGGSTQSYVSFVRNIANACDGANAPGFVIPGSEVLSTNTAAAEGQFLNSLLSNPGAAGARGAFLWDYREIKIGYSKDTIGDYFKAINQAFSPPTE